MPDNVNPMSRRISGKVTFHKYLDIFSISYVVFSPNETDLDIKVNVRELYYYNIHHMYIIIMVYTPTTLEASCGTNCPLN